MIFINVILTKLLLLLLNPVEQPKLSNRSTDTLQNLQQDRKRRALSCAKGGFPSIRHNEIRDLTATLLTEVCNDVCIEPELQPVTDEELTGSTVNSQAGARLDIAAHGVWGSTFERTFFDVRVFNPHAPSNRHTNLQSVYRKHEQIKKRAYEQRIREVEHATFSPLVLSATGGLAREANIFYKRLASMLASKWDHTYSSTLCWLRCRLVLLPSALLHPGHQGCKIIMWTCHQNAHGGRLN